MNLDALLDKLQLMLWALTATALGVWLMQVGIACMSMEQLNY